MEAKAIPEVVDCIKCRRSAVPVVWLAGAWRVAFHVAAGDAAVGVVRSIVGAACVGAWAVVAAGGAL